MRLWTILVISLSLLISSLGLADTVTLKNGAAIDGIVTGRHEGYVVLSIGNVGTMKIPEDEVSTIEKNARTGYLDPDKGKKKEAEKLPDLPPETEKVVKDPVTGKTETPRALAPELEAKIKQLVQQLTLQRTTKRTRAEKALAAHRDDAIPELIQLADHPFDRTRTSVFRLLKGSKDFRVVEPALKGMDDNSRFVRKLAWEVLKSISGKKYPFPWDKDRARTRAKARDRWAMWVKTAKESRRKAQSELPRT